MPDYSFTKSGVQKLYAFDAFVRQLPHYESYTFTDPNLVYTSTESLDEATLSSIQSSIENYTDPEVFLQLISTLPDTIRSSTTNSDTPEVVQTFIYTVGSINSNGTFNAIKTVLEYQTNDITQFLDFNDTCFVTFEIFCYTRGITISSYNIDITDIVNTWKTNAQNNQTGHCRIFKTFMVEGLRNSVANYDCLWNYKLAVSNPNINVTIHAKQMLYYDIL